MVQSRAGAPGLPLDAEDPAGDGMGWGTAWVAVGLSGEHYWAGWRRLVTLPMVTSSCQCLAAVPGDCSHHPSLLLFLSNYCEG